MAMADVDGSSLVAGSHAKSVAWFEGWWPSGTESAVIRWTRWTLTMASQWWQHHKHCHWHYCYYYYHNRFTALFPDHPGEPVPEENFWTLWCKGRLTEADTLTIRVWVTPSGLTSAHLQHPPYCYYYYYIIIIIIILTLHHPPYFFMGQMPLLPNQQRQSTEGN